jgi:hypothetical protein
MPRPSAPEALRRLTDAVVPYGLRVELTPYSFLPELVILRPGDGLDVVRLRYIEPDDGPPAIRSVIHNSLTQAEQLEIEAHIQRRLGPLVAEIFSAALWIDLLKEGRGQ